MFYKTLHEAIRKEDVEDVEDHIKNGTDINGKDKYKKTPLLKAIEVGNTEIVELLLKSKAIVTLKITDDHTPMELAVLKRNFDIVKLIVDAGGKIESGALNFAVCQNNFPIVKLFLQSCAGAENTDLLKSAQFIAFRNGLIEMAKLLIDAGAPVIPEDVNYNTGLHIAAEKNSLEILNFILSYGACVNVDKKLDNKTALHLASYANKGESHYDFIERLLEHGANVNLQDSYGRTALHCIDRESSLKTIELLLKFGADVNVGDYKGEIPYLYALSHGNIEIVRYFVQRLGADVNYVNPRNGSTPLHKVDVWGKSSVEVVKFLLKDGAKINAVDFHGSSMLLHKLKNYRNFSTEISNKALKFLLKHSDVNVINSSGDNVVTNLKADGYVWKTVLGHIAKLKALGLPLHQSILNTISTDPEFRRYFNKCTQELLLAKNTKPRNSWITYFDVLVANERMLKNYAANPDLQAGDFEEDEFKKKFRIYGASMRKNVIKGMKRRELFDESTVLLYNSLPIFNPTHLVIRDILDCITTKDLSEFTIVLDDLIK